MTGAAAEAAESLQADLAPLDGIRTRKMFGGFGVFEGETMFALVDSAGVVFFKADETNLAQFEQAGSEKHARMPYYQVPDAVLTDRSALLDWARSSIAISKK